MCFTVADWDSMSRVIKQTRHRAFSFLLNRQKLGRVFQKLFERLSRMFWNKCSAMSFDQPTHLNFLIISLHKSNKSPEIVTKPQISDFNFEIFFSA